MRLAVIGGGRAAWTMGSLWRKAGWKIAGLSLRPDSRSSIAGLLETERFDLPRLPEGFDAVLLAVSDDAIAEVYAAIRHEIPATAAVFHASGLVTSSVLDGHDLRFSLHPLCSLPPVGREIDLDGMIFVFEGAQPGALLAKRLTDAAGAEITEISAEAKPEYHAAAVFASNYVATLLAIARDEMEACGIALPLAEPLARLARSAIANWSGQGDRFTGPVARGDAEVVARHMEALAARPARQRLYRALAIELCSAILKTDAERPDLKALRERLLADNSS